MCLIPSLFILQCGSIRINPRELNDTHTHNASVRNVLVSLLQIGHPTSQKRFIYGSNTSSTAIENPKAMALFLLLQTISDLLHMSQLTTLHCMVHPAIFVSQTI